MTIIIMSSWEGYNKSRLIISLFAAFLLILVWPRGCGSVILHKIHVPRVVLNGSLPSVLLDCHYSLNHSERGGLVLKWYLNGQTIYQWIPPRRPIGLGALRGRINLDYEMSPAPYAKHRALYIYHPTTEMTGDYTCKVSTLENEVSQSKKMVVYEPPRHVDFLPRKSFQHHVNLTCVVDHVFPEPKVELFHKDNNEDNGRRRVRMNGFEERSARYSNGAWQKLVYLVVADTNLRRENVFDCEVSLPNTDFLIRKSVFYQTDYPTVMASASGASTAKARWRVHQRAVFWAMLFWFAKYIR